MQSVQSTSQASPKFEVDQIEFDMGIGSLADVSQIERNIAVFNGNFPWAELIALDVGQVDATRRGVFDSDHRSSMAQHARDLSGNCRGVFIPINPFNPETDSHLRNRMTATSAATTNATVIHRTRLYLDFDPIKAGGFQKNPASTEERRAAFNKMKSVLKWLLDHEFPEPLVGDTGNGYHLYFSIDETKDSKLPERFIKAISQLFSDGKVDIDKSVHDPARITRCYGTQNCKNAATPDRPHRYTKLIHIPDHRTVVGSELLQAAIDDLRSTDANQPLQSCLTTAEASAIAIQQSTELPHADKISRARAYITKLPAAVEGEGGDRRTYSAACVLIGNFDLTVAQAMPIMLEFNERCRPRWEEAELRRKLLLADESISRENRGSKLSQAVVNDDVDANVVAKRGKVFLIPIPDFIPIPAVIAHRQLPQEHIERRRGRPAKPWRSLFFWIVFWQIYEQSNLCPTIPDALVKYIFFGADGRNGWRRAIRDWGLSHKTVEEENAERRNTAAEQLKALIPALESLVRQQERVQSRDLNGEELELVEQAEQSVRSHAETQQLLNASACTADCPLHGKLIKHQHYNFNESFLYDLYQPLLEDAGGCTVDFDKRDDDGKPLLEKLCREQCFTHVYILPRLLGAGRCMSARQARMLSSIVFETTRRPGHRWQSRRGRNVSAHVDGGLVRGRRGKGKIRCDYLDPQKRYVQFNGNVKGSHGSGYHIAGNPSPSKQGNGGWLARVGYGIGDDRSDRALRPLVKKFIADVRDIRSDFELVAVGLAENNTWFSVDEMYRLAHNGSDEEFRLLRRLVLRFYTPDDFLVRWRRIFCEKLGFAYIGGGEWNQPAHATNQVAELNDSTSMIAERLKQLGITRKQLASAIGWHPSRVSRQLTGKSKPSKEFIRLAKDFLADCSQSPV
ncbi:helix-turn-helix domain-containing protein [Roseiconus lacunae]|uniref:helix-turn-helix domain-containing protein n=1 Tax=Roseiconus lacunae TaxID=2605694 RepID=UPI001E375AF2|nr:helix-turn-helix transcriptional regulator [Roseiconus lacunae]